jgi:hypothetical protein
MKILGGGGNEVFKKSQMYQRCIEKNLRYFDTMV